MSLFVLLRLLRRTARDRLDITVMTVISSAMIVPRHGQLSSFLLRPVNRSNHGNPCERALYVRIDCAHLESES
ncbi:MAG: hypothetical protein EA384_01360 [Spirochaetaceae bacterium]|nr:MAG: hypothetical protein EA384_01360 [Spirochaetaceae bacterium]